MAIKINDDCIGCKKCVQLCPCDVLRFDQEKNVAFVKYEKDCQLCSMCVFDCPTEAIKITHDKSSSPILAWG